MLETYSCRHTGGQYARLRTWFRCRANLAARCHAGKYGRRHHRIPPCKRPKGIALPRCIETDHHRQCHLPGGIASRKLRRDRHGASTGTPDVQGHAKAPDHHPGFHHPRHAHERHHVARPHQLFRTVPGQRRQSEMGNRDGSRSHGQFLHRQKRPRFGNDGGAQWIRDGRKLPVQRDAQAHAKRRLRLAQLWQIDDRQS